MFKPVDADYFRFEKKDLGLWLSLTLFVIFYQTSLSLLLEKSDNGLHVNSHNLLLTLIALSITVKNYYDHRDSLHFKLSYLCAVGILLALPIWLLATISFTQVIAQIILVGLFATTFCLSYGHQASRYIYTSLAVLLSIVPMWSMLNMPLRTIAAHASSTLLNLTGFSNLRKDLFLHIEAGIFHVDTGCSGISQLLVAIAIAFIYAWYVKLNFMRSLAAATLAATLAVIANIVRIYIIIALGALTDMQHYFITVEHISLGWVVFAVFIYFFFMISDRIFSTQTNIKQATANEEHSHNKVSIFALTLALGLFIATSIYANYTLLLKKPANLALQSEAILPYIDEEPTWYPAVQGASQILHKVIAYKGAQINLHIYFYAQQSQGLEAINSENKVAGEDWHTRIVGQNNLYKAYLVSNRKRENHIALQSYWIDGKFYKNQYKSKLINSLQTLAGNPHIAFIVISSRQQDVKILEQFSQTTSGKIASMLTRHSNKLHTFEKQ